MFIEPIIFLLASIIPYNNVGQSTTTIKKETSRDVNTIVKENTGGYLRGGWYRN